VIPYPFCRVVFAYGEPIPVPRDLDEAGVGGARLRVERALLETARRAEEALGEERLWKA